MMPLEYVVLQGLFSVMIRGSIASCYLGATLETKSS